MILLSDLIRPLTVAEATERLYVSAAARGLPTTSWKSGAVVRTIIAALAVLIAAFSQLQALIARSGFLALSTGDWLTLVARYVYDVERDAGSFATGETTLSNASGNVYTLGVGDLVVRNPSTNQTYRNTAGFTLGAFQTGLVISIRAEEIGAAGTSPPGTVTAFVTPLIGVTSSNVAALVGADPEDDATLRLRCSDKTGTLSPNGPKDAYGYFARTAKRTDGTSIGVVRTTTTADGVGGVTVYVATSTGTVDPGDLPYINDAIRRNVEPHAVTATAVSATALVVAVTYELWVRDTTTLSDTQINDAVTQRLIEFMTTRPIGGDVVSPDPGRVYKTAIESIVGNTVPDTVRVAITAPASDVSVTIGQCPVLGSITQTAVHRVAGAVI